jgi:penicillin-binding protein 2
VKRATPMDKIFTRRAVLLGAGQAALLALLGGRLAWLQVVEGPRYKTLADENRIDLQILPPARGEIVDITGAPLAKGERAFALLATPEEAHDLEGILRRLQRVINLPDEAIETALRRAGRGPGFIPVEVKEHLTWPEVAAVSVRLPDLPGLSVETRHIRRYPLGPAAAHPLGYVGAVSRKDLQAPEARPILSVPGFKIGKAGLERALEDALRGKAGAAEVEINARGRRVRELSRRPPALGATVRLTLHAGLQSAVAGHLARERSASAVVLDIPTGAVRALVSHPAYDPNAFVRGLSAEEWEGLLSDPGLPLTDKAVGGLYPPASTFKMVTALAALEAGTMAAPTQVLCPGHFDYGGHRFHCWNHGGHGSLDVVGALTQSCDTFFYQVGLDTGIDAIAAMARRLGLGASPSLGLPEEKAGLVPDKAWKAARRRDKVWHGGETVIAAIGQGYLQATPLQLAVMTARLASGSRVRPFLVESVGARAAPRSAPEPLGLDAGHLALVKTGMRAVMTGPLGTGRASAAPAGAGWQIAGKTGTAQVRRITQAQRDAGIKNEDLVWARRHHALFVGYAPVAAPRYACCVVVEHGISGGRTAAPLARDILADAMRL